MPFTDDQRAQIRLYMGMPKLFNQSNPILENAMVAIDNLSLNPYPYGDSGATQARMILALQQIDTINTMLVNNTNLMLGTEVMDEVKFDAIRNAAGLRQEGRRLINQLSIPLSMKAATDFFGGVELTDIPDFTMHKFD